MQANFFRYTLLLAFSFSVLYINAQTEWWKKNNLRVIQLNLPDYEAATIQPIEIVEDLEKHAANTLIINAGGIMAFYPSKLASHYINPYMRPGVLSQVIKKCHEKNIKVMVRFDFSRADKSIFEKHPDWFYISPKGERMINTDKYVVSINAPYVQEEAFKIVEEVIDSFAIDGIFQNMPGYLTRNSYENTYMGIDQNEYDKKAFFNYCQMDLPKDENKEDTIYRKYEAFKKYSTELWQEKMFNLVKSKNRNIAICTYAEKYVDIIRHESQTNSLPYWPYSASDNVANATNSYPNHIISNASIQQISFQSRYNAVEPEEVEIRLWENIANGSGLDMSMMGDMRGYEDERNFGIFKKVYQFHKANEKYFGKYKSLAKVVVIAPGAWPSGNAMQEYRGIQLMLKEAHIDFDVLEDAQIEYREDAFYQYKIAIFPDISYLSKIAIEAIKKASRNGLHLLATNQSFFDNATALKDLFGAEIVQKNNEGAGNYLQIKPKEMFPSLKGQSMIHWKFNLGLYKFGNDAITSLPILDKGRPGPPELIGGHVNTGYFAMGSKKYGKANNILLPENIGKLYFLHGYEQNKLLLLDVLRQQDGSIFNDMKTNAHPRIETIIKEFSFNDGESRSKPNGTILHLINLTGFSGNTYFEPLKVSQIQFEVAMKTSPKKAYYLSSKKPVLFKKAKEGIKFVVETLTNYEAVVFEY
jgi:hypothetical protein